MTTHDDSTTVHTRNALLRAAHRLATDAAAAGGREGAQLAREAAQVYEVALRPSPPDHLPLDVLASLATHHGLAVLAAYDGAPTETRTRPEQIEERLPLTRAILAEEVTRPVQVWDVWSPALAPRADIDEQMAQRARVYLESVRGAARLLRGGA